MAAHFTITPVLGNDNESPLSLYLDARQAYDSSDFTFAAKYFGKLDISQFPIAQRLRILGYEFSSHLSGGDIDAALAVVERAKDINAQTGFNDLHLPILDAFAEGDFAALTLQETGTNLIGEFIIRTAKAWAYAAQGQKDAAIAEIDNPDLHPGMEHLLLNTKVSLYNFLGKYQNTIATITKRNGQETPLRSYMHYLHALTKIQGRDQALELARNYQTDDRNAPVWIIFQDFAKKLESGHYEQFTIKNAQEGMAETLLQLAAGVQNMPPHDKLQLLQLARHISPIPEIDFHIANTFYDLRNYKTAIAYFELLNKSHSLNLDIQRRIAITMIADDQKEDALDRLYKLHARYPDHIQIARSLSQTLRRDEQWQQASDVLSTTLSQYQEPIPENWQLFFERGIAFEHARNWARAEQDLVVALDFQPENPYLLNYLGYSLIDRGKDIDRGMQLIRKAIGLSENNGMIIDSLGWAHYLQGNYTDAVRYLEQAIALEPSDPVINDHLGDAYWHVGRKREAEFQWQRAIDLSDDEELAKKIDTKLDQGL
ncbi:MAG: tetratricopeptide repeat protein [Pseudomonadota bacterium]